MMKEDVIRLNEQLKGKKAEEVLDYFFGKIPGTYCSGVESGD